MTKYYNQDIPDEINVFYGCRYSGKNYYSFIKMKKRKQEFNKIKELMKEYYEYAEYGFFNTRNIVGDKMFNLFNGEYFQLDLCYEYGYYEVFGASFKEFIDLTNYYSKLRKKVGKND